MFETVQQANRLTVAMRLLTLFISILCHLVALTVIVVIPLVFLNALPEGELLTFLTAPPPPPAAPPPPPPPQLVMTTKNTVFVKIADQAPGRIPGTIVKLLDEPPVPDFAGLRIPLPQGISTSPVSGQGQPGISGFLKEFTPAPPLPPPPAPKRKPVPVGGKVLSAKLIHKVEPAYPELARRARISGVVILQVMVDEEGNVSEINVVGGPPLLREAAVQAVGQWKYSPTLLNGEPVPVAGTVTIVFTLK